MEALKKWWAKPYDDGMSVKGWFCFLGLIAVISVLWHLILREISESL
jgi:hypothetical protein